MSRSKKTKDYYPKKPFNPYLPATERRFRNWAASDLPYALPDLITYNLPGPSTNPPNVSIGVADTYAKSAADWRKFVKDCLTIFWDIENFSIATPESEVLMHARNARQKQISVLGRDHPLSTPETFFVIPATDVEEWVDHYIASFKRTASHMGLRHTAIYLYCRKNVISNYPPTCDKITDAFAKRGAVVIDCIVDYQDVGNLDDRCDNRLIDTLMEFFLAGAERKCKNWGTLMFMTGDIGLRYKVFEAVSDHVANAHVSIPHFFCASGASYTETGPHRPWFTHFAQPASFESAYFTCLSDPCFFDDFAGVVIPDFLPIDDVHVKDRLPLTPQEEQVYSRLQPVSGTPGFHPNFSHTGQATVPLGNDFTSQTMGSTSGDVEAFNKSYGTTNPRNKMDIFPCLAEEIQKQEAHETPSTSQVCRRSYVSPAKRQPDDDLTPHESKLPRFDLPSETTTADSVESTTASGPIDFKQAVKTKRKDKQSVQQKCSLDSLSSLDTFTDTVTPLNLPPIIIPDLNDQAPIHPNSDHQVIAFLVSGWCVFPLADMESSAKLSSLLRLWLLEKYPILHFGNNRTGTPRTRLSSSEKNKLDVPRFFAEGDNIVIKEHLKGGVHFVLMLDHYMKPVPKEDIDKHKSGQCLGFQSRDLRKCKCFKNRESMIPSDFDPINYGRVPRLDIKAITFPDLPFPKQKPESGPVHSSPKWIIAYNRIMQPPDWMKVSADQTNVFENISGIEKKILLKFRLSLAIKEPHRRMTNPNQSHTHLPLFYKLPDHPNIVRNAVFWDPSHRDGVAFIVMEDHFLKMIPVEIIDYVHTPERCQGALQGDLAKCRCFVNQIGFYRGNESIKI